MLINTVSKFAFKLTALLSLLLINSSQISAYEPVKFNYSIENRLPTNEVYDLYQDDNGFIWIASGAGLLKFNGTNYQNYSFTKGLNSGIVFSFFEESKTNVWISTIENHLYQFNPVSSELKFYPYVFNDSISKALSIYGRREYIRNIWRGNRNELCVSFYLDPGILKITKDGNWSIEGTRKIIGDATTGKDENLGYSIFLETVDSIKIPYSFICDSAVQKKVNSNIPQPSLFYNGYFVDKNQHILNNIYGVSDYYIKGDTFLVLNNNKLIIASSNFQFDVLLNSPGLAVCLFNNEILVGTETGLEIVDFSGKRKAEYLSGNSISEIIVDRSKNIWVATLEQGIFIFPDLSFCQFLSDKLLDSDVHKVIAHDDKTFIFTSSDFLYIINSDGELLESYENYRFYRNTLYGKRDNNLDNYFGIPIIRNNVHSQNVVYKLEQRDTFVRSGTNNVILYFAQRDTHINFNTIPPINNCKLNPKGNLYLMTNDGVFQYNRQCELQKINESNNVLKGRFQDAFFSTNYVGFVTQNRGVVFSDYENFFLLNTSNGLSSDKINVIEYQNDTIAWIGTLNGLSRLIYSPCNKEFSLKNYRQEDGVNHAEIFDVELIGDSLWVASRNELSILSIEKLDSISSLFLYPLIIDSIKINSRNIHYSDSIQLKESDLFELFITQISFQKNSPHLFEYRLFPDYTNWISLEKGHIILSGLIAGTYQIELRSKYSDHEKGPIKRITLIVHPPWFKSGMMIFAYFLFIMLLVIVMVYYIRYYYSKQKKREVDRVNLELEILVSKMNPHFMFNTINSIQHFIINNNRKEAIEYLSDFALLMRKTLYFTSQKIIPIKEEIDFLNLYIELEKLRFEQEIILDVTFENIQQFEIKVPPFLLQPLIENAIIHGRKLNNSILKINVHICKRDTELIFCVSDNGRGFHLNGKGNNPSMGLNILKRRIALLSDPRKNNFRVESIIDIGTKVCFSIDYQV